MTSGLPYPRFRETLKLLAEGGDQRGYHVTTAIDSDDCWLSTWANDDLYVIVQASLADPSLHRTLIDVHAGGGYGAEPHGSLFQALATATWRYDYGSPWARIEPSGKAAYGWRSRLPSVLFNETNIKEAFSYILGQVDAFGATAGTLASEFIPIYGGRRCHHEDPDSWPPLLSGLLPPQENESAPVRSG